MSEPPKCYSETHPVARKEHRCCECLRTIKPGEKYRRFSGIWDEPGTYKQCEDCADLFDKLTGEAYYEEGPVFTQLWDELSEEEWDKHAIKHGLETIAMREERYLKERQARIAEYQAQKGKSE